MGLLDDIAGVVVAEEGLKKVDPNAGILAEGATAVAGVEGAKLVEEFFEKKEDNNG